MARSLDAELDQTGRTPQQGHVAHWLRRGCQQESLGFERERLDPPEETLLYDACQRAGTGKPEPAGQLRRRQPQRQLQQRERVPPRLGDDPIAHPLVQSAGDHRVE
jgi:hypothetical protein